MTIDFKEVEKKWLKFWEEHPELYRAIDVGADLVSAQNEGATTRVARTKAKKYVLVEFPYPSGSGLHIGHAFTFTGGDCHARFKRMSGWNVLFPMGWDAFGLPTENYAIKMKKKPQDVTKENTDMFRNQMKRLGFSFDWSREINTTDPAYYKWTQWIFIKLFEKGLAYKKEMPINWCPSCKIGLANEEVVDGKCERCGSEVSRRNISQWVVKITDYADKLIEGLNETAFIEKVKQAQINWIGKSEGAKVKFKIKNPPVDKSTSSSPLRGIYGLKKGGNISPLNQGEMSEGQRGFDDLEVFTTRPDTLFGATFMVVAPEHKIVLEILNDVGTRHGVYLQEIRDYVESTRKKSDLERIELTKEKTGVFSGLYAINPATGKEIPIWISDFVLASYGTGAIMSVPAHDERDEAFAKKFGLEIIGVYDEEGRVINSEFLNGLTKEEAIGKMTDWLSAKGIGEKTASYHLRDWIFSRQHYWGEPIPMINCSKCGWVTAPETDLPIKLPEVEHYEPTDDGQSPLSQMTDWVKTTCPKCGGEASRETDTMPNWAGSDWYFLRYMDPHNDAVMASPELMKYWGPVDVYIGGDEHNVLHLLYSRFIYKFLWDLGAVPTEYPEPYFKRLSHGVILGPDNQRMSKSKGNVIIPEVVADIYGVDVVRMYLMFMGPFDATMAWNENTLMGVKRFLDRMTKFCEESKGKIDQSNEDNYPIFRVKLNRAIKKITEDYDQFKYNTAIAQMMELLNDIGDMPGLIVSQTSLNKIIKLLAPVAPYISEEWWSWFNNEKESVHAQKWPEYDDKYLIEATIKIAVSINGKVRDEIEIESAMKDDKQAVEALALKSEKIKTWLAGKQVKKLIYVPGRMVNLVVG